MNKIFSTIAPLTLSLAASLMCATAHAAQQPTDASPQVVGAIQASQPMQEPTRQEIYQQLVQAQKDGSLARQNGTYAGA